MSIKIIDGYPVDLDELKSAIISRGTDYLQPDRSGKGFICPICGSGSGKNGTGITSKDNNRHFTCWTGCYTNADIIDIIGQERGISSYPEKLKAAAEELNISLQEYKTESAPGGAPVTAPRPEKTEHQDFKEFYREAHKAVSETEYLHKRGLSDETINHFNMGYVSSWRHPKCFSDPRGEFIILPITDVSYTARYCGEGDYIPQKEKETEKDKEERKKKEKQKVKAEGVDKANWLFNESTLSKAQGPIFIVEGEIDAASIYELGGYAVSLGSCSFVNNAIERIQANIDKIKHPFIIALDNDDAGVRASDKLAMELKALEIPYYRYNPSGAYKDPNERLQNDRTGLYNVIKAFNESEDIEETIKELGFAEYAEKNSVAAYLQEFIEGIGKRKNTTAISTGFKQLDTALDGGLRPGLITLGAASSTGKTTLCLQIADNIAASGKDVIYISLEMSQDELIAKSISRQTLEEVIDRQEKHQYAKTVNGILDGSRYAKYCKTELDIIQEATRQYEIISKNIYIYAGLGDIGPQDIKNIVDRHVTSTGNRPVVIIDYLQILAPTDAHFTDKMNTDRAVFALKGISRDYNIPVIAISSLNRGSYQGTINMAAFKESGAIEYTSDVLLGYQYQAQARGKATDFNEEQESIKPERDMQIIVLKNRSGRKGDIINLGYQPMFNYLREK